MGVSRILGLLLALGGCDALFGLQSIPPFDATTTTSDVSTDGPGCTFGEFGIPLVHFEFGTGAYDPQLRGDLLEVFFHRGGDLYSATRTDTSSSFGDPVQLASTNAAQENDPTVTADGLLLMFQRGTTAWQVTREHGGAAWSAPTLVAGLQTSSDGLDLAPDGLTVYFTNSAQIWSASRATRQEGFGPRSLVHGSGAWPSISGDERELYFTAGGGGVSRASRERLVDAFENAVVEDADGSDADISPDGRALIMIRQQRVQIRYRECVD
jgi:hypothetical protein